MSNAELNEGRARLGTHQQGLFVFIFVCKAKVANRKICGRVIYLVIITLYISLSK